MYQTESNFICDVLTLPFADEQQKSYVIDALMNAQVDWVKLFHYAGHYWLLPSFYKALQTVRLETELPDDVLSELEYIYQQNTQRNQRIVAQLQELIAFQNNANIAPLLVKGSAFLLYPLHAMQQARMMSDIDIVVMPDKLSAASQQFIENGYIFGKMANDIEKHITGLYKPGYPARVDLHFQLLSNDKCAGILPPALAMANARLSATDATQYLVMQDEFRLIHQLCHDQLQDRGYVNRRFDWRQMYDYVLIRLHCPQLNMDLLNDYFEQIGARRVWRVYQILAKKMFPILPELDFMPNAKEQRICMQFLNKMYGRPSLMQKIIKQSLERSRPLRLCLPRAFYDKTLRKFGRYF